MGLKDIAKKYQVILKNGTIMSNRYSVDLLDQRIGQLLERIDNDEAPERMAALYEIFQDVKRNKGKNEAAMYAALSAMDVIMEAAYHDYEAWKQIMEILDTRRKLIDSEIKVVKDLKAILTAEQAKNMIAKLLAIIMDEIKDPKTLRRITYRFTRLIGENDLQGEPDGVLDLEAEEE